jgi:hypothetical protein
MNNSEQVHASSERKVYFINFSKPSLHFLLGKLEFIIKNQQKTQENASKEGGKQNARTINFSKQR